MIEKSQNTVVNMHVLYIEIVQLLLCLGRLVRNNRKEETRLLVSGQNPEISDCLLSSMEQHT